jgi:ABC-type bacteriocin/lantibiotic exporter with double-glycine peptidase domain
VPPFITAAIVDEIIPTLDSSLLLLAAVGFLASQVLVALSTFLRSLLLSHFTALTEARVSRQMLMHLGSLPLSFFGNRSSGELLTSVNCNSTARDLLTSASLSMLIDGPAVFIYAAVLGVAQPGMAAGLLGLAMGRVAVLAITKPRQRVLTGRIVELRSKLQTSVIELVGGIETLKAMGLEKRLTIEWLDTMNRALSVSITKGRVDASVTAVMFLIGTFTTLLVTYGGAMLVIEGQLTLGEMLAIASLSGAFVSASSSLASSAISVQAIEAYTDRVDDVMNSPAEPSGGSPISSFSGMVELDNVQFAYDPSGPPVLREVSLTVKPGAKIVIVGRTGCGKSTLARLIAGLLTPSSGEIRVDGRKLSDVSPWSIRRRIGLVAQETHLFGQSIRSNVSLSRPNMAFSDVIRACELACIHDEIVSMGGGYEAILSDRGASLSGGQRQRLALARAIAARPSLLILDEATSQLDPGTERRVLDNVAALGAAVVAITHRLGTIGAYDSVIVLDRGTIVDQGTAHEVTARGSLKVLA